MPGPETASPALRCHARRVSEGADRLEAVLGTELPEAVRALPEAVRNRLAAQVEAACKHHDAVIEASVKKAIAGVPLPVRGAVRKALGA